MMNSNYIIDVTEADFEYEVLAYSNQVPVVVDFWAEWCGPCRTLGPLLTRLANEADGAFRLAKLNVDDNPNLARRYNVRSIPAVKGFREGKVVAEFLGAQPEPQVRAFLNRLAPEEGDLALEKGSSLLTAGDYRGAEAAFREALLSHPEQPAALLGLSKSLLLQGRGAESAFLLKDFPASREFQTAEQVRLLAEALSAFQKEAPLYSDDPLEAAYFNALRLIERGNFPAAIDGLLDVLRQDKRFRKGQVHQVVLGLLALLGDEDTLSRQYRKELAQILF